MALIGYKEVENNRRNLIFKKYKKVKSKCLKKFFNFLEKTTSFFRYIIRKQES